MEFFGFFFFLVLHFVGVSLRRWKSPRGRGVSGAELGTDAFATAPTLPENKSLPTPKIIITHPKIIITRPKIVTSPTLGGGAGTCALAGKLRGAAAPGGAATAPAPRPFHDGFWERGRSRGTPKGCPCARALSNPDPAPPWHGSSTALVLSGFQE